jgi:hypothetical protein
VGPGGSIGENHVIAGLLAIGQWLEDHVIAALRQRRAVPGPVEGDERAAAIGLRKLAAVVNQHVIRRPVSGKRGDRSLFAVANAGRLAAVAAIFRRQHELVLVLVEVAFRPAKIGALMQLDHFLGRRVGALLDRVELRPVLRQLVTSELSHE